MTASQVLMRRYSDVDINNLLAHFVDTLLEVEEELEAATDWQWDSVVRDACRQRKQTLQLGSEFAEDIELSEAEPVDADPYVVPFDRPRDPK